MPTRETIKKEATKGVEHGEVSLRLGNEVDTLEEASDRLNTELTFPKANLKEFKSRFSA